MTMSSTRKEAGRLARQALGPDAFMGVLRALHFGPRRCRICGAHVRRFMDQGYRYDVLFQQKVIGGIPKAADECPVCRANSRIRLVYLYLDQVAGVPPRARVLHIAPERALQIYFRRQDLGDYVVGDIEPERYLRIGRMCRVDVTDLHFDDQSFDLVLCNHVLEHVPDDAAAMRELFRVLKPGGRAILQVPFALELEHTQEAEPGDGESDFERKFGQRDHVRLYAKGDYVRRLREAGFDVEEFWAWRSVPDKAALYDIDPLEPLFVCHRR